MSAFVRIECDGCHQRSVEWGSRIQDVRERVYKAGWRAGYVHKPYPGKRADFCPACVEKMERPEVAA